MLNLNCLFTIYCDDHGLSHIFLSLCRNWRDGNVQARMMVPSCPERFRGPDLVEAVPSSLRWLIYRDNHWLRNFTERKFLNTLHPGDAAYLFPNTSVKTLESIKKSGVLLFLERFNCYTGKAKQILDDAYARLGVRPAHQTDQKTISDENVSISLADFVFCPSPQVKKSFLEMGASEDKLILTSYGWSPDRFSESASRPRPANEVPTILFVGAVCVRKGAHLLLRAWEAAQIRGRLILCGAMEAAIADTCAGILARSDVLHLPYQQDVARLYAQADVFAFPSLEEGGPLVMYEAMAHGLPVITSPMGAGSAVRDGIDGVVLSPYETAAWIDALRSLAANQELRLQYGSAGRVRANEFTWKKVAARRAALMLEKAKN